MPATDDGEARPPVLRESSRLNRVRTEAPSPAAGDAPQALLGQRHDCQIPCDIPTKFSKDEFRLPVSLQLVSASDRRIQRKPPTKERGLKSSEENSFRRSCRIFINAMEARAKQTAASISNNDLGSMSKMVKLRGSIRPREFALPRNWIANFRPSMPKFRYAKKNVYRIPRPKPIELDEHSICNCDKDKSDCGDDCLNRLLLVSCMEESCPVGDRCKNQAIIKGKTSSFEPFCTELKGWGLRATADTAAGTFIVEYTGEVIGYDECTERYKEYLKNGVQDFYFLTLTEDQVIDAFKTASAARFINHSCEPNCRVEKWTCGKEPRIAIVASTDIKTGGEITIDYGYDQLRCKYRQPCFCGTKRCRGYIGKGPATFETSKSQCAATRPSRCFSCGKSGRCDAMVGCTFERKGFVCGKSYHLKCVDMNEAPMGQWHCSRHVCDSCKRRALTMCPTCPGSWCRQHYPLRMHETPEIISEPCTECFENGPQFVDHSWRPWQQMIEILRRDRSTYEFKLPMASEP